MALSALLFWSFSTVGVLTLLGFPTLAAGLFTYRRGSMELLGAYTIAVMLLFVTTALVTLVLVAFLSLLGIDWQSPTHAVLPSVWASRLESAVVLAFVYAGAYYLVYRGGYSTLKRRVEQATAD